MKESILLFLLVFGISSLAIGQNVVLQRSSDLMPQLYSITGDAFLEELSNGDLTLRLSSDFNTPAGPDVRILLGNSLSTAGTVEVVNLSAINHFSGARTFPVPAGVAINDFDNILFFCVAFQQFWASGVFGNATTPGGGGGFICENSGVTLSNGNTIANICPTDNVSDVLSFSNSLSAPTSNFAYLITDGNDVLTTVINGNLHDFEGSSNTTERVYGIHFDGTLNPAIGSNRMATTATGCFTHSLPNNFVTVLKTGTCISNFECFESQTSTTNSATTVDICPTDGTPDSIVLQNNLNVEPGEHYAYLITDENEILQQVVTDSVFNFEGTSLNTQRVYGIHFDGSLIPLIGVNRMQTSATDCFTHSSSTQFLTVTKDACFNCLSNVTFTTNSALTVDICPTDGTPDSIVLQNNLFIAPGANYAYLITDENQILQQVVTDSVFNFEGSSLNTQRVYGIHFDGTLNPIIGANRTQTTATGCFTHSNNNQFLTVTKDACFNCLANFTSTTNAASTADICPNDGDADWVVLQNNLNVAPGANYAYLITDENQILQQVVTDSIFNFEGSSLNTQHVYGVHFDGTLNPVIGANRMQTTASGCFTHSNNNQFLTITKDACFDCLANFTSTTNATSTADICPNDGDADWIVLQNNLNVPPGEHYAYLITDENQILQQVVTVSNFNFEGSSLNTQRVYGIHFDGTLNPVIGANRMQTTATNCFTHSNNNQFLTITKEACFDCFANFTSTTNAASTADICPNDGDADWIVLQNNLNVLPGEHYAYLITDENQILQEVVTDSVFNFEGSSLVTQRVYGVHFDGTLNPQIGANRMQTTASRCFTHSNNNQFLSITKNGCVECLDNFTSTTNGGTTAEICPTDGNPDPIILRNNLSLAAGEHYAYLITDENQILQQVVTDSIFNFEGSSLETQRVYGIHFDGTLNPQIGANRMQTTASRCFTHSNNNQFLTVTKDGCALPFECFETVTTTSNSVSTADICPNDGNADWLVLSNNLSIPPGEHYAYLITDENQIVQQVVTDGVFNFEGTSLATQRVYGIHFDGTLNPVIGANRRLTTASGCFTHSGDNVFLTITKEGCFDCLDNFTASTDARTNIDICPNDGNSNPIALRNNLSLAPGEHYAYLITDENQIVQQVVTDSSFDFEGTSLQTQRVYGIHFDGTLNPVIGANRRQTTATRCFTHSDDNVFLTITKEGCFDCLENFTASTDAMTSIDICPNDGTPNPIVLRNNLSLAPGEHYAYLITDENQIVQQVVTDSSFDFEGSSLATQRVYGIHFDGTLNPVIGANRRQTTATGCFTHSNNNQFLTVTKNGCFDCLESFTATTDWANSADICPNDGNADWISFRNNLFITEGDHYAYLITDENQILQQVVTDTLFNFEGSSLETQRVYGVHFDGTLNPIIGADRRQTTATGCFAHSRENVFVTITKESCVPDFECLGTLTATTDWVSTTDICPNDGVADWVVLRNNLFIEPGEHYAYLITDENQIVQEVVSDLLYNFEGSSSETQRVYGVHFDGTLIPIIGANRRQTTATGCFTHSNDNLFLTITKESCVPVFECLESLTATTDWATTTEICPTDGTADWVVLRNNLFIEPGEHYAYLITDENQILQEVVTDSLFNFDGSSLETQRVYGVHFDGTLNPIIGANRMQTTATGCFTHSGDGVFLTITKGGCAPPFECLETLTATLNWATNVDICTNDGALDTIKLVNNLFEPVGENYVYLFTDESEILQEVVFDSLYNFEGTGEGIIRVYGLSYDGDLSPQIGQHRKNTTASECFIHSGDNLFLTINRTSTACTSSTTEADFLLSQIEVFPNPNNGEIFIDYGEIQNVNRIEIYTNTGKLIQTNESETQLKIDQSGIFLLRFITENQAITKRVLVLR